MRNGIEFQFHFNWSLRSTEKSKCSATNSVLKNRLVRSRGGLANSVDLMFKRFTVEEHVSSTSQIKNSVQRSIVNQISEQYPLLVDIIETILPKKAMLIAKAQDNIQLVVVNNEVIFYNQMNGPFFPTLKLLHKYPTMMPRMQCDKGAIRFVLGGANIMCPGFTSKGGFIEDTIGNETPVAVYAEGKQHAMAIGLTKMSKGDICSINKGVAVETVHYLMDGLWQTTSVQ